MSVYTIEAATTQDRVQDGQCDVVETADTLKEAKARAKYLLTSDFQISGEMSECLGYARVMLSGECVADFFQPDRKANDRRNQIRRDRNACYADLGMHKARGALGGTYYE